MKARVDKGKSWQESTQAALKILEEGGLLVHSIVKLATKFFT
jgi:hypothetical protein